MISIENELGDTTRRRILQVLEETPMTVNQIVEQTGFKQPNVSNHLGRLRSRGIVKFTKDGRQVRYELASPEIEAIVKALVALPYGIASNDIDFEPLCERLWRSAIQGDEDTCTQILDEAFRSSAPLLDVYDRLLAPAMRRVGDAYCDSSIDEAQEHMASEIVLRLMARSVRVPGPPKLNGKSCIVGCVPQDYHTIGPRMATDYLKLSGWKTMFCGANVPIRSFLTSVLQNRPSLALVCCTVEEAHDATVDLVGELDRLRKDRLELCIGVGGVIPDSLRSRLRMAGADFVTSNLRHFALKVVPEIQATGSVSALTLGRNDLLTSRAFSGLASCSISTAAACSTFE